MKLGTGLIFYNDLQSLKRGIPSFIDGVDQVYAIDGRFSLYSGKDYSEPEVIEYLKSFDKVIIDQFIGMEHDKRQRYVNLAKENKCDAIFIIDSDEYILEADWELFKKNIEIKAREYPNQNFFGVNFRYTPTEFYPPEYSPYPRVWIRPEECSYFKAHCIFQGKQGITRSSAGGPVIEGMKMTGNDDLRSKEYLNSVCKYQEKMLEYEIPIRIEFKH